MAKASEVTQNADASADVNAVNEPTLHQFPTQQTETPKYLVAKEDLFFHGVRAHAAGDLVPADNVDRNGWGKQVSAQ